MPGVEVAPLDEPLGRRAGALLRSARTADVIDAALIVLARDGDEVITSDAGELAPLASAAGTHLELVPA